MEVITYSEWLDQTERQTAQQIALLTAQNGADGVVDADNFEAFPSVGIEGYLYLAKDTGKLYSWNTDEGEYVRADSDYSLPTATDTVLGGVKIGSGLTITEGVLSANAYTLPTAASDTLGGVKIGSGLSIDEGVLSANGYTLPTASASTLGGVKVGSGLTITGDVLSYTLPTATDEDLGGVRVGDGLTVEGDGTLNVDFPAGYTLPAATDTVLGGVISGDNVSVDGTGKLSVYIQKEKVRVVDGVPTITDDDNVIIGTGVGISEPESYNVTLPSAVAETVGRIIKIKNVGTISMSITPDGSDTIDGASSSVVLAQSEATTLLCYEANKWCEL